MSVSEVTITLENGEEALMMKSLLETLKKRDDEIERLNAELHEVSGAESLASNFLACEIPETASDFARFVLKNAKSDHSEGIDACIYALAYHNESMDNKDIDDAIIELKRMKTEEY